MLIRSRERCFETREGVTSACVDGVEGWSRNYKSYTCFYPKTHWEKVLDWIAVDDWVTIQVPSDDWDRLEKGSSGKLTVLVNKGYIILPYRLTPSKEN